MRREKTTHAPPDERMRDAASKMFAALKAIEAHHAKLNAAAGRDEERSTTLRLAREGLDAVYRG